MRVNQKDTGAGTHNFTCPNLSSDYDTLIKKMNSEYFKDPIVKFIYDSEIVLDANYDLNKDGILNIDDINTIEFIPIKDSFYNEIMRLGRDTFKTIFVFLTNDLTDSTNGNTLEGIGLSDIDNFNNRGSLLVLNAGLMNLSKTNFVSIYIEYWAKTIAHEFGHLLKLHHANTFNAITAKYEDSNCGAGGGTHLYDDNHNVMDYCPYSSWSSLNSATPSVNPSEKITFKHFQWKIIHKTIFKHFKKSYQ